MEENSQIFLPFVFIEAFIVTKQQTQRGGWASSANEFGSIFLQCIELCWETRCLPVFGLRSACIDGRQRSILDPVPTTLTEPRHFQGVG